MSFIPDDTFKEVASLDNEAQIIALLKAIAWLLADQQDENLKNLLRNMEK